jgi:hypothetical protein
MKLKQFFKNSIFWLILAIIVIFGICHFSFNFKEGLENNSNYCPDGCEPSTSSNGNCTTDSSGNEICSMYCNNTNNSNNSNKCQYDSDCLNCPKSKLSQGNLETHKEIKKQCKYIKEQIKNDPNYLKKLPEDIQKNFKKDCLHHNNDNKNNNNNVDGNNWKQIGSKIGKLLANDLTNH